MRHEGTERLARERAFHDQLAADLTPERMPPEEPGSLETALLGAAQLRPGMRVLDLGCGSGDLTISMLDDGAKVTALDISPMMVHVAERGEPARGRLFGGQRRQLPQLRGEDGRHARLLGLQPLRAGNPADGHLPGGQRQRQPHLRREDERNARLLGYNASGQAAISGGNFTALSAGARHTCASAASGDVSCWGADASGQATPPETFG